MNIYGYLRIFSLIYLIQANIKKNIQVCFKRKNIFLHHIKQKVKIIETMFVKFHKT